MNTANPIIRLSKISFAYPGQAPVLKKLNFTHIQGKAMATRSTTIYLIRHGEVHNPQNILYGRLPRFRLSARGLVQAQTAGIQLKQYPPLDAVFSSPMLRTRQTAKQIQNLLNNDGKLHISALLNEVYSAYEGQSGSEIDARGGDVYTGAPACFEQPRDVVARARKFIFRNRRRYSGGHIAAVTHGDVITFMILWAKGKEVTPKNKTQLLQAGFPAAYPAHASITSLSYHSLDEKEHPNVQYLHP